MKRAMLKTGPNCVIKSANSNSIINGGKQVMRFPVKRPVKTLLIKDQSETWEKDGKKLGKLWANTDKRASKQNKLVNRHTV